MIIANKKKQENIAEYLLYMWQVEDIIRANDLDIDSIQENIIDRFDGSTESREEIRKWYADLIEMMKKENVIEKGHLQINKNVIINLTDFHNELLKNPKEEEYKSVYYNVLPFIVELRSKNQNKNELEIETCFSALYGLLILRLQDRNVSGETQAAVAQISSLLRLLAKKYKEQKDNYIGGKRAFVVNP